jgi:hypothetical protein
MENETSLNSSRNEGRGEKGEWCRGMNSTMTHLIFCKKLCKATMYPLPSTAIKYEKKNMILFNYTVVI